jgi:hypothetical protein
MMPRTLLLLAVVLGGSSQAAGGPPCRPTLAVREASLSDVELDQRTWSARIAVDARRCATASGRFDIRFVRRKENAPDETFREQFGWVPGEVAVSTLFAADEAVGAYWVEPLPCPCGLRETSTRPATSPR